MADQRPKQVVVNCYVIHPLIANKDSCVLTVLLPFSNFGSTQRGCLTSKPSNNIQGLLNPTHVIEM